MSESYTCTTTILFTIAGNLRIKVEFDTEELVEPKMVGGRECYYAWCDESSGSIHYFETPEAIHAFLIGRTPEALQAASQIEPDVETDYTDED